MSKHMYISEILLLTQVFEWHRRFWEGSENVQDDERSERQQTSRTAENIEKISAVVLTHLTNGRGFPRPMGERAFDLELGLAGKKCNQRRERNSPHWPSCSSPIGRKSRSEEKGSWQTENKNLMRTEFRIS
ncbi:hypothetical protein TNCV_902021 [Trichonephila clavipes]|nr:hypothetical protein TNCV_902021 [Trichonephila clavipes]